VQQSGVRPSIPHVGILTVTHQGAAHDAASIHFSQAISRTDIVLTAVWDATVLQHIAINTLRIKQGFVNSILTTTFTVVTPSDVPVTLILRFTACTDMSFSIDHQSINHLFEFGN